MRDFGWSMIKHAIYVRKQVEFVFLFQSYKESGVRSKKFGNLYSKTVKNAFSRREGIRLEMFVKYREEITVTWSLRTKMVNKVTKHFVQFMQQAFFRLPNTACHVKLVPTLLSLFTVLKTCRCGFRS